MAAFARAVRAWFLASAGFVVAGCFYYDSRWGQSTAEQKRAVARLEPAALGSSHGGPDGERVLRVRAHATRAYAAETLDWQDRYADLLDDASAVLKPAFGFSLESAGASLWQPSVDDAKLEDAVSDLAEEDSGDGADWVVGFVQSTPKLVTDFHVLGVGRTFSKYLVVRASNNPAELDLLSKNFQDVDEGKKERVYRERRHHQEVIVFLHELAHTLGAVHRTAPATIMNPTYDPQAVGFDDATIALLRLSLAGRFDEAARAASYRKMADYLRATPNGWVESERDEELRILEANAPAAAPSSARPAAPADAWKPEPAKEVLDLDALPKRDRQRYDEALSEEKTDVRAAWDIAKPLFESAPAVLPVQALRCRLAKEMGFFAGVVEAHCARYEGLRTLAPRSD